MPVTSEAPSIRESLLALVLDGIDALAISTHQRSPAATLAPATLASVSYDMHSQAAVLSEGVCGRWLDLHEATAATAAHAEATPAD
jgi:hypothetical protein